MLVETFLAGQAKLDAAKLEIKSIVRALSGAIEKCVVDGFAKRIIQASPDAYWEVLSMFGEPVLPSGSRGPMIRFITTQSGHEYVRFGCIGDRITFGDPHDVMATREALESLVAGVFKEFPHVHELAKPVLEMAG